jgi:NADH-quinone oxidoreductase subunit G
MHSMGVTNLECRQDGARVGGGPRQSYLFNTTIAGVELADALLFIGCNPRWEAPVLNARIHKTWLNSAIRIANAGVPYNLTYPVEQLGGSAGVLGAIADGSHAFAGVLRDAKRPMVIVGAGALARPDGAAILNLGARIASNTGMIGPAGTAAEGGWNGFNVLHNAASRLAALDLGFLPGEDGRDMAGILDGASKGEIEFVWLLGADEFDMNRLGNAFVVYQGTHGDAGAHHADVILPGAAYTEQDGIYVNFEGRVQRAERATFPPGQAKEDWAILRAFSDVIGHRLPYDNREELRRALFADVPHLAHEDVLPHPAGADPSIWNNIGTAGEIDERMPLASSIADFYLTNPIARASETMAECSKVYVTAAMKLAAE